MEVVSYRLTKGSGLRRRNCSRNVAHRLSIYLRRRDGEFHFIIWCVSIALNK